jgi:PAS domain S-box-containing protein
MEEAQTEQTTTRRGPSGVEATFDREEIIVSKTDTRGRITYANHVFLRVAGYTEQEILGKPHSFIRHPDMPRCVFKVLWDTIERGDEVFAYVVNMAKNGDHYWVLAHVTPTFDAMGRIVGYHSNRRCPDRSAIDVIRPLYAALLDAERGHLTKADAIAASTRLLDKTLEKAGLSYEAFVFSLSQGALR